MNFLKAFLRVILLGLFLSGLFLLLNEPTTTKLADNAPVMVADCDEIFTIGDVHTDGTVFQGNKMVVVLSAAGKKFAFSKRDNSCWKFIGSNDRPKKKERVKKE